MAANPHAGCAAGDAEALFTREFAATTRVLPGELHTTSGKGQKLVTLLGSCVSACVRDPITGFGGMNHFMLPASDTGLWNGVGANGRFGNLAMDSLIDIVLRSGCARDRLEVKIFGGADLYRSSILVGTKNVEFVQAYLSKRGLHVAARDVGGRVARKIIYEPETGRVMRQAIRPHSRSELLKLEQEYQASLEPVRRRHG